MQEIVLTSLFDLWPQEEQNSMFLGPWCFANNTKYKFEDQINFNLIPSPYKSKEDLYLASKYIENLFDRLSIVISKKINKKLSFNLPDLFWKRHFASWMLIWLSHYYDRYLRVNNAFLLYPDAIVKLPEQKPYIRYTTYNEYLQLAFSSNLFNLNLFRDILVEKYNSKILYQNIELINPPSPLIKKSFKKQFKRCVFILNDYLQKIINPYLYIGTVYGISNLDKIFIKFKTRTFFCKGLEVNTRCRKNILLQKSFFENLDLKCENEFEKIVIKNLSNYIPEDLFHINFDKNFKIKLFVGNDIWLSKEPALKTSWLLNAKVVSAQHGGAYGKYYSFLAGKFEYELNDAFLTWGWKQHIYNANYIPMSSPMLSKIIKKKRKSLKNNNQIVLVSTMEPPYQNFLSTSSCPEKQLTYMWAKKDFILSLKTDIYKALKYRPYFYDGGQKDIEFVSNFLNKEKFIIGGNLLKHFKNVKMVVVDHISTTYLQTFVLNIPTFLYYDPTYFTLTKEAELDMQELANVGIVFFSPIKLAEHINIIWDNAEEWWNSSAVQIAVKNYCIKYAKTNDSWQEELLDFFKRYSKNCK